MNIRMPNKRFPGVWDQNLRYLFARKQYLFAGKHCVCANNIVCVQRTIVCAQRTIVCAQRNIVYVQTIIVCTQTILFTRKELLFARKEYLFARKEILFARKEILFARKEMLFYCAQTKASDDLKSWHIEATVGLSPGAKSHRRCVPAGSFGDIRPFETSANLSRRGTYPGWNTLQGEVLHMVREAIIIMGDGNSSSRKSACCCRLRFRYQMWRASLLPMNQSTNHMFCQ